MNGHCAKDIRDLRDQEEQEEEQQELRDQAGSSRRSQQESSRGGMKISNSVDGWDGPLSSSLKSSEAQSWRRRALCVSWVSVVLTTVLCAAAFTVSFLQHSSSAFGFGFDAFLDVFSSVIVLWRYSSAAAVYSPHRDNIACLVLGVLFIVSFVCIAAKSVYDLIHRNPPEVDDFLLSVSVLSGVLCSILALIKFFLGRILKSRALVTDGFNSLVGALVGFSILMSAEVYKNHPDVWYLDGAIGIAIALVILVYGVKLLLDTAPRLHQRTQYESLD